jgi:MFS transporter, BCD family, chlorophyll transporter
MSEQHEPNLTVGRNIKIGLFHLGSGMADVITTGIWNRIMITDLGFNATPIGLLVSLRYFLAPLGVWAGRMSDRRAIGGYRRLFWVWLGRLMMVASMIAVGLITANLARGVEATPGVWASLAVALALFSLGSAISGSTFLALLYDRARTDQRGRAVGIVWTFLLLGFAIGGILFALILPAHKEGDTTVGPNFTPETLQNVFLFGALLMAALWFISLLGEERRSTGAVVTQAEGEHATSLRADLKLAWSNRQTRFFFWYLALSMLFAFAQDLLLEPFAGEVFKMDAAHTTRFTSYWGSTAIVASIAVLFLGRRFPRLTNTRLSFVGVGVLVLAFVLFGISALALVRPLVTWGLVALGVGLGIWNIGTTGLMMEMSPFGRAGTFLGFWTMVVTISRGIGVSGSGVVRDVLLSVTGNLALSYGLVFVACVSGLLVSLWMLRGVNVTEFQAEQGTTPADTATVLATAMD